MPDRKTYLDQASYVIEVLCRLRTFCDWRDDFPGREDILVRLFVNLESGKTGGICCSE